MKCACGAEHELLDPVFRRPEAIVRLPPEERRERASESEDLCALKELDGTIRYYVRCLLPVALTDARAGSTIEWGVWAEVGPETRDIIRKLWRDRDQARHPALEAALANRIPGTRDTLGLPLSLKLTGLDTRPEVRLLAGSDHPFARECQHGVPVHRAYEWLAAMRSAKPPAVQHVKAYICNHVFKDTRPILLVVHDADGDWSFMCGGTDGHEDVQVVGRNHVVERDPTLRPVLDLSVGEEAERHGVGSRWVRRPIPLEEE